MALYTATGTAGAMCCFVEPRRATDKEPPIQPGARASAESECGKWPLTPRQDSALSRSSRWRQFAAALFALGRIYGNTARIPTQARPGTLRVLAYARWALPRQSTGKATRTTSVHPAAGNLALCWPVSGCARACSIVSTLPCECAGGYSRVPVPPVRQRTSWALRARTSLGRRPSLLSLQRAAAQCGRPRAEAAQRHQSSQRCRPGA